MKYLLGIDLGTSSLKGSVYTTDGRLIDSSASQYDLIIPTKGYSEQNPQDWIKAFKDVVKNLSVKIKDFSENLDAISFSGQMHSLVLLDENGEVLRNAILWNDVRTTDQCNKIMNEFGEEIISINKNIALEGFTLPKILWVMDNEPEIWEKTRHILLPKDYLRLYLTGNYNMDFSDAAGTLLLDIENKKWSREILEKFSIDYSYLPDLVESIEYTGDILADVCDELGIKSKVKVYAGAADNAASAVGAGIIDNERGMVSVGTSGVILANKEKITGKEDGKLHTFNAAIPNTFYSMGVTLAAGKSLDWLKSTFAKDLTFEEFLTGIENVSPGSNGLLFTPYIQGERTPHNDSMIRGSFVGMDISHKLENFVRAVLEGITYSLRDSLEIIDEDEGDSVDTMVSVGGGAKNKTWLQMQADIFNKDIVTLEIENGPSTGAAMLAAVGAGYYDDFGTCAKDFVKYKNKYQPNPYNVAIYEKYYQVYRMVYPNTSEMSKKLQDL